MDYFITFLEGIVTFVSPCLLPMLPIYLAYFAGQGNRSVAADVAEGLRMRRTLMNAFGFVIGFTLVFLCLGAFAGAIGGALTPYSGILNLICGIIIMVLGLHLTGWVHIPLLQRSLRPRLNTLPTHLATSVLFGIVFSIGWTPCVGAYLGSALMLASAQGSAAHGSLLLLVYSLGLGIPFIVSALVMGKLAGVFGFFKRHGNIVNTVCGLLLIVVGLLMGTGHMNVWLAAFSA